MRISRLVTKERLRETIEEALENMDVALIDVGKDSEDIITDAVWSLLGELDSEDDFGVALAEEDESNA